MKPNHPVINTAIASLLALGNTRDGKDAQACGGAGMDRYDCGGAIHSCAGRARMDSEPAEWKYVAKGSCQKLGGQLRSPTTE